MSLGLRKLYAFMRGQGMLPDTDQPRDIMSDTPRTDAAFARCVEEGGPHEPFHGPLIKESEALERELAQAQARYAEIEKDAARYRHVRAKPHMLLHLKNSEFDAAIDAALKEPR